jgi:hypothetical protein
LQVHYETMTTLKKSFHDVVTVRTSNVDDIFRVLLLFVENYKQKRRL